MVEISKGKGRRPSSKSVLWCWLRFMIKCDMGEPSVGLLLLMLLIKLAQSKSKCRRKLVQTKRRWLSVSLSCLQMQQRVPSVFLNQGIPPFSPRLPINLTWVWRQQTKSGNCSEIDQNLRGAVLARQSCTICRSGWSVINVSHALASNSRIVRHTTAFHVK